MQTVDNLLVTDVKVENFTSQWVLKNVSFLNSDNMAALESPAFFPDSKNQIKCSLKLFLNGDCKSEFGWVIVYLNAILEEDRDVRINCELNILDENKEPKHLLTFPETMTFNKNTNFWSFPKWLTYEKLKDPSEKLLINDTLTINCKISIATDISNSCQDNRFMDFNDSIDYTEKEFNTLERLFDHKLYADITLIVGENEVKAHKCILASRSPVFLSMLNNLVDSKESSYAVDDMEFEVLEDLLRYIYTGEVDNLEQHAESLLVAGYKYILPGLKESCQKVLQRRMNVDNVCDMLVLADQCSADDLKNKALHYILSNNDDVIKTQGYQKMIIENAHLLVQAFHTLGKKMKFDTDFDI